MRSMIAVKVIINKIPTVKIMTEIRSMWIINYEKNYIFMMKTIIRSKNLNYKEDSRKKKIVFDEIYIEFNINV